MTGSRVLLLLCLLPLAAGAVERASVIGELATLWNYSKWVPARVLTPMYEY